MAAGQTQNSSTDRHTISGGSGGSTGAAPARPHVIRNFVLATSNIEAVSEALQARLEIPQGIRHDMAEILGFRNEMMKIGQTLFEMVQPVKPDHRLHRWLAERGGDAGYMIVLQTFDAEAFRARVAAEKLRLTRDMQFRGQQMIQFDPKRSNRSAVPRTGPGSGSHVRRQARS